MTTIHLTNEILHIHTVYKSRRVLFIYQLTISTIADNLHLKISPKLSFE